METLWFSRMESPLGELTLVAGRKGLQRIVLPAEGNAAAPEPDWRRDDDALAPVRAQLTAYFAGERRTFDLALAPAGTPFQLEVLRVLATIPFGTTRSYGELARTLGRPKASRAVGAANARNPLPIVLPCHRVVGSDGSLTGYAGGLDAKRWLLRHEGIVAAGPGLFD